MKCFRCDGELKPITKGGIGYAQCNKCGSLFTAQELQNRLTQLQQPPKQSPRPSQAKAVSNISVSTQELLINHSSLGDLKREFIAFDLETTGFSPARDRIVEIGAVRFVNKRATETFDTLVHSDVPIPPQASRVNGITNEMISTAPSEFEAISKLIKFLGNAMHGKTVLCAHNASFDMGFLHEALKRCRINSKIVYVDTLAVSKTVIKGLENYKQATVLKHFNLSNIQAHRAQTDALCCGKIMCKLLPLLEAQPRKTEQPVTVKKTQQTVKVKKMQQPVKKNIITEEEMQICIYIKSLLREQPIEHLDYLRCDKISSGHVKIICIYPFITFRIMKKGKYIIIPKEVAKRKKIMGEPCTKDEPLDGIRYFFDSLSMLDIFAKYFNRAFMEEYRSIKSYLDESDYYYEKTLDGLRHQTKIPDAPKFFK